MTTQTDAETYLRFQIIHHLSECECRDCGAPLYVGDTFIAGRDGNGNAFCSRRCAENHTGITITVSKAPPLPVGR